MALNDVPGLIYSKDGKMSFEDTKVGRMKREIFDASGSCPSAGGGQQVP